MPTSRPNQKLGKNFLTWLARAAAEPVLYSWPVGRVTMTILCPHISPAWRM